MADFENYLESNIPKEVRTHNPNYGYLVSFARTNKIKNIKQLKSSLNSEIDTCNKFMRENKTSQTNNRVLREYARKLSYFKKIKKLIDKYL